jgi:hypothetical protein
VQVGTATLGRALALTRLTILGSEASSGHLQSVGLLGAMILALTCALIGTLRDLGPADGEPSSLMRQSTLRRLQWISGAAWTGSGRGFAQLLRTPRAKGASRDTCVSQGDNPSRRAGSDALVFPTDEEFLAAWSAGIHSIRRPA